MRPVNKLNPGQYSTVDGSVIEIKSSYPNYRDAKPALVYNFGKFCCYCEEAYHQERDLHVEHVQPKSKNEMLKTEWSNFLLSCATCNGSDNKGTKDVVLGEIHLPHLNNTFKSLVYKAGGVVEVNPTLNSLARSHAEKLWKTIGLNKSAASSSKGDTRWKKRMKDWDLAIRHREKCTDVDTIIDLVKARGGWSIWFTVFKGHDEVRKALIENFPGTSAECFDPNNHYEPIDRHPGLSDPT